jgi:hypothetical protein
MDIYGFGKAYSISKKPQNRQNRHLNGFWDSHGFLIIETLVVVSLKFMLIFLLSQTKSGGGLIQFKTLFHTKKMCWKKTFYLQYNIGLHKNLTKNQE